VEKPDPAKGILLDVENIVAAKAILFSEISKIGAVKSGDTRIGGYPEEFIPILKDFINIVGR